MRLDTSKPVALASYLMPKQAPIAGVYVLPPLLSLDAIRSLVQLRELKCHHDDGHGGHGGTYEPPEEEEKKDLPRPKKKTKAFRADKPHLLPWLASLIREHLPELTIDGKIPHEVDAHMQLYHLQEGTGVVPQHVDEDFDGPDGSRALCSILIYLNDDYTGGETVFNGTEYAPHVEVGGGLLFRHDLLHEGLMVRSGEKFVLKTDLFFR